MLKSNLKFLLLIIFIITACNNNNCLKPHKSSTSKIIALKPITKIILNDNIQTFIYPDSNSFVEIIYSQNLINKILIKQEDSTLIISNENKCNWIRKLNKYPIVNIHTPYIEEIISNSSQDIIFKDTLNIQNNRLIPPEKKFHFITQSNSTGNIKLLLYCPPCHIQNAINDVGDIYLNGNVGIVTTNLNGAGYYYAQKANTAYNFVYHHGTGNAHISNLKGFQIILTNSGNVFLKGGGYEFEEIIKLGTGKIYRLR